MHPTQRYALMLLWQSQQDNASELVIASATTDKVAIRCKVNGKWHDYAPPPAHIPAAVIVELQRLAGIENELYPKEGTIKVPFNGTTLNWKVAITAPDAECVLTPILAL